MFNPHDEVCVQKSEPALTTEDKHENNLTFVIHGLQIKSKIYIIDSFLLPLIFL